MALCSESENVMQIVSFILRFQKKVAYLHPHSGV